MVAGGRVDEARLEPGSVGPIKLARDDDASNRRAVAADPLGDRLNDNVGAELEGADEVASAAEGVVDDEGDLVLVGEGLWGYCFGSVRLTLRLRAQLGC